MSPRTPEQLTTLSRTPVSSQEDLHETTQTQEEVRHHVRMLFPVAERTIHSITAYFHHLDTGVQQFLEVLAEQNSVPVSYFYKQPPEDLYTLLQACADMDFAAFAGRTPPRRAQSVQLSVTTIGLIHTPASVELARTLLKDALGNIDAFQTLMQTRQLAYTAGILEELYSISGKEITDLFASSDTLEQFLWDVSAQYTQEDTRPLYCMPTTSTERYASPWTYTRGRASTENEGTIVLPQALVERIHTMVEQELLPFVLALYSSEAQNPFHITARLEDYIDNASENLEHKLRRPTLGKMAEFAYLTLAKDFLAHPDTVRRLEEEVYGEQFADTRRITIGNIHKAAHFHDHCQRSDVLLTVHSIGIHSISIPVSVDILLSNNQERILEKRKRTRTRDPYTYRALRYLQEESTGLPKSIDGHIRVLHHGDITQETPQDLLSIGISTVLDPHIWRPVLGALPKHIKDAGASHIDGDMFLQAFRSVYGETIGTQVLLNEIHKMQHSIVHQLQNKKIVHDYEFLVNEGNWRR